MSSSEIDLQFTNEKYVFINVVYGFRGGQAHAAVQESRRKFLNRRRLNRAVGGQQ
jgi:protein involved in ribonucleotide reduction